MKHPVSLSAVLKVLDAYFVWRRTQEGVAWVSPMDALTE